MSLTWWLSIGAGVLLMAGHAGLRVLTHRLALQASARKVFLVFELGGLGGRMALVFGAVALVLLYAPVHEAAFVGTVLALLIVSMVVETRLILRRMERETLRP
jgi:hypothetical protein